MRRCVCHGFTRADFRVVSAGGDNKDVAPTPILLRSGDVVVMGGESRLAYHGVPRVLPESSPADLWDTKCCEDVAGGIEKDGTWLSSMLRCRRVNVNLRQVLRAGDPFPEDATPPLHRLHK